MFSYVLQNTQCIWMYYLSMLSGTGLAPSMQSHCIKLYFHPQCLSALLVCIFADIRYCDHFHVSCGGASAACYTADWLGFHWLLVRVTQHPVACLMGDLAILFYEVPPESGIYYYCESVWLRHSMPQPACGGLWRRFSPYTFRWDVGIELGTPGLHNKHLFPVNHLAGPWHYLYKAFVCCLLCSCLFTEIYLCSVSCLSDIPVGNVSSYTGVCF